MSDPATGPRWSRPMRARLGYLLGVVLAAAGLGWQVGPGWGLVALGAAVAVMFVWLYPVDDPAGDSDGPDDSDGGDGW